MLADSVNQPGPPETLSKARRRQELLPPCLPAVNAPSETASKLCEEREPRQLAAVLFGMDAQLIQAKFRSLGARAKVRAPNRHRHRLTTWPVVIDVQSDRHGEFFDIQADRNVELQVLDVQPRDRHLLLMVRQPADQAGRPDTKDKFLCGHDERHWFAAGVPESISVSSVITAKEALKPEFVRDLERGQKGKLSNRQRRKNQLYVRQGEWFFVPAPSLQVQPGLVLRNEPLRRGSGKPHVCEFLSRSAGTLVYVNPKYPNGLTEDERRQLFLRAPALKALRWQAMTRDPTVYVRGRVAHADHATIQLDGWHRVWMNTEHQSRAARFVAFLD